MHKIKTNCTVFEKRKIHDCKNEKYIIYSTDQNVSKKLDNRNDMALLNVNPDDGPIKTGTFGNIQIYESMGRYILRMAPVTTKRKRRTGRKNKIF